MLRTSIVFAYSSLGLNSTTSVPAPEAPGGAPRPGLAEADAVDRVLILTSFPTYDELRVHGGRSPAEAERVPRELAAESLLAA